MNAYQLDLLQSNSSSPARGAKRLVRDARARYWFHQMRRTVDAVRDWAPAPSLTARRETAAETMAAA